VAFRFSGLLGNSSAAPSRAGSSDTLRPTPWNWDDEEGVYVGTNGQVWLYRALPVKPMTWEDPATLITTGDEIATLLGEIGGLSKTLVGGIKHGSRNREVHLLSVTWDGPATPPAANSDALIRLQREFLQFTTPQRALLLGVRLWADTASNPKDTSVKDQMVEVATKLLLEDTPNRAAYDKDREKITKMVARAGGRRMTADEKAQLESWYNKGRGPATTIIEDVTSLRVPAYDTFEMSTVMRFNQPTLTAPDAPWALEAKNHPHAPCVVSVRGELEPPEITRSRARTAQRRVDATLEEEAATGDLERAEYSRAFQQAKNFEDYVLSARDPILTSTSILMARKVRVADETYIDQLRAQYGIEIKPLEHRQHRALDEMLPCSSKRANPFLQEVSLSMVAHAGLNGFASLGDASGLYTGVANPDHTPVFTDVTAAARSSKPAATLISGDSGSGKSYLAQSLAIQAAVDGQTTIFINPKGWDSLAPMAEFVGGTVVKMSALEGRPGAFDPFRYAPPSVAAEIATNHILSVLGGDRGFSQAQQLEIGSALKNAAAAGARCVGDAFPFIRDKDAVQQITQQVEGSSLFALGIALEPAEPFGAQSGMTLIEFDRKIDLPAPDQPASSYTRRELTALAAVRLVSRASLEILMLSNGGVLVVDEAWTFLGYSEGLAALQQLGREGRSLGILPIFATQRVSDVISRDMKSYLSRVFCLAVSDEEDATAGLELCDLEPTAARINWLKNCGPKEPDGDFPGRPAMALHRDIAGRHSAVMIWPTPDSIHRVISTNPDDRAARERGHGAGASRANRPDA